MNIYIGFSYPKKFKIGSKAISWWMGKPYSHVYLRFESSDPEIPSNVYHAAHGMVHFREFGNFQEENNIIIEYIIPITKEIRKKTLINCMFLSGEKYGTIELGKIFISDVLDHTLNKEIQWENGKGYICSELVGELLGKDLGIKFPRPLYLLKPCHIDNALDALKYERRTL